MFCKIDYNLLGSCSKDIIEAKICCQKRSRQHELWPKNYYQDLGDIYHALQDSQEEHENNI